MERYFECANCQKPTPTKWARATEQSGDICKDCEQRYYTYSSLTETRFANRERVTLVDTDAVVSLSWALRHAHYCDGEWYENVPGRPCITLAVDLDIEPAPNYTLSELERALGTPPTDDFYISGVRRSLRVGVTLATFPFLLDVHVKQLQWKPVLSSVHGIASSRVCLDNSGMRVRINKLSLTNLQLGRMMVFLNSRSMRGHIRTLAELASDEDFAQSAKVSPDRAVVSRGARVIMDVTEDHIEVQMFCGTLNHLRVLKNLEFCHALASYCERASLTTIENWEVFVDWVWTRPGRYPHLLAFLVSETVLT